MGTANRRMRAQEHTFQVEAAGYAKYHRLAVTKVYLT